MLGNCLYLMVFHSLGTCIQNNSSWVSVLPTGAPIESMLSEFGHQDYDCVQEEV